MDTGPRALYSVRLGKDPDADPPATDAMSTVSSADREIRPGSILGPAVPDLDEDFQRERLLLFGKIVAIAALVYLAFLAAARLLPGDDVDPAGRGIWVLAIGLGGACLWATCSRPGLSRHFLEVADSAAIHFVGLILALHAWYSRQDPFTFSGHGGMTLVVLLHAVIVPGTTLQMGLTTFTAYLPILLAAFLTLVAPGTAWPREIERPSFWLYLGTALLDVGLAATIAHLVHGLRREATEAKRLQGYTLEEKIGEGASGSVWKARHALLRRPTALKVLRTRDVGVEALARFEREVQLTSRLTHPNIVTIFDYGRTEDGIFYYAMEYIQGADLGLVVRTDGPQPAGRVLHILDQVCAGLEAAHSAGLLHRDIKPGNIVLWERGWVHDALKIVDFGLVKDIARPGTADLTKAFSIRGTPHTMAPELYRAGIPPDARSDLYSLGCVGYYLLTGGHVFEGTSWLEVLRRHREEPPQRPSERGVAVPEDLERIVLRCLEKSPEARPASATELREELRRCASWGSWTPDDAGSWWRRNGEACRAARSAGIRGDPDAMPTTLTEDLPAWEVGGRPAGGGARE